MSGDTISATREYESVLDIYFGDNLEIIRAFPDASFDLIYIDPPFNTGKTQARTRGQSHQTSTFTDHKRV